jgi:magnesium transporter
MPVGSPPGSLPLPSPAVEAAVLRLIQFDSQHAQDTILSSVSALRELFNRSHEASAAPGSASHRLRTTNWLDVDKITDTRTLAEIGEIFSLHPLALEDVANVHQHAKVDVYGDTMYLVARMPIANGHEQFDTEQISIFFKPGWVITFQEIPGDCLDCVRARIAHNKGRVRKMAADYLVYAIYDAILDGYFPQLGLLEQQLDSISEALFENPGSDLPLALHHIRSNLLMIRKLAMQHKDAITSLLRDTQQLISPESAPYFRDCLDHSRQIMEAADIYRETCGELRELFFADLGQRNNQVIKVLTVISTLFIPMSFIAGIYGMNFDRSSPWNMPELGWLYGYPFALGLMVSIGIGLMWYLWTRRWL